MGRRGGRAIAALFGAAALLGSAFGAHADGLYSFDEAVARGVVDMKSWAPPDEMKSLFSNLASVNPGILNRFGFFWGGPSQAVLDRAGRFAAQARQSLPQALFGAAFSETVKPGYNETFHCGGDIGDRTYTAAELTSGAALQGSTMWVDMAKPATQEFYRCIGRIFLDEGFSLLHFEESDNVLKQSSDAAEAAAGYGRVAQYLTAYARRKRVPVYFSGEPGIASVVPLSSAYVPARFYTVTVAQDIRYQNRVSRPGIGVGYAYVLSPRIVADQIAQYSRQTKIFFYVDNWDNRQDDLRRFMELDAVNRRYLITESAKVARAGGAVFVPPLDHCQGCDPPGVVGDRCEILPNGQSEYNAVRCGDMPTIAQALRASR